MSQKETTPVQQTEFYTPTSTDMYAEVASEKTEVSPQIAKPVDKLSVNFGQVFAKNGTKIFHNGDRPGSPVSPPYKERFEPALKSFVQEHCGDLFDQNGILKPESAQEWNNVTTIAPEILRIFTSRDNYMESVYSHHTLNLIKFSIDAARRPDILADTTISVGFGGSDDEQSSTRLPAYTIPAASILRDLKEFYENRETKAINGERETQALRQMEFAITQGERPLSREEKRALRETLPPIDQLPELSDEETEEVRQKHAIPGKLPKARYFFGSEAARAINRTMNPEGIRIRTAENLAILDNYIQTEFPDVADNIEIIEDIPWHEHSTASRTTLHYFAHVLEESTDESVVHALDNLRGRGEKRGGQLGSEKASLYGAAHPPLFGDRSGLPFTYYLEGVLHPSEVNITIGGRTEQQFVEVRNYLSQTATIEGLIAYVEDQVRTADSPEKRAAQEQYLAELTHWKQEADQARAERVDEGTQLLRDDEKPNNMISMITELGKDATYYYKNGKDSPHGFDIDEQLWENYWQELGLEQVKKNKKDRITETDDPETRAIIQREIAQLAVDQEQLRGVRADIQAIIKTRGLRH